jgi:hypothetical protein
MGEENSRVAMSLAGLITYLQNRLIEGISVKTE